jgi:hypothetical protein
MSRRPPRNLRFRWCTSNASNYNIIWHGRGSFMLATAICPNCGHINELMACTNDGGTDFRRGPLSDGSVGMICKACNLGYSHFYCQSGCGTLISAASFETPISRIAGRAKKGMDAYEGRSECFYCVGSIWWRCFRDRYIVLSNNPIGTMFVADYCKFAPKAILGMRRSRILRFLLFFCVALSDRVVRRTYPSAQLQNTQHKK